jgi:acyl-coenzyme A thioesterase PaaI-like protein
MTTLNETLGQQRVVSNAQGRAVIEYVAGAHMCHSGGVVQGGFISGWLDAAMAHAAMSAAGGEVTPMSLELKVSFFAPARPGLVIAEGWVERQGRSVCFPGGAADRRRGRRAGQGLLHRAADGPDPGRGGGAGGDVHASCLTSRPSPRKRRPRPSPNRRSAR